MRIAISRECLIAGFQIKEIVDLFKTQSDFDAGKSRYYIEYLAADPYPPFKCKTIEELCFCLGDSCPFYRKVVKA
jgi:DNA primase large subunit